MLGGLFGGGEKTVKSAPWKAQQPYLREGFARAQDLLGRPALNDLQQQGMEMATGYADSLGGLIGNAQNTYNFLTNPNLLSPDANPYLAQQAQAVSRGLTQNLTENVLPAIGSNAELAGQYGSSRQGIAEGLAIRGTQNAIADQTANLYSNAYNQGLNTMLSGLSQSGQMANLGLMPSNIYNQIGSQQQAAPWQQLQNYMGAVSGNYGGTQTTPTSSPLGALLGAGVGGFFGGVPGAQLGMGVGSLLG